MGGKGRRKMPTLVRSLVASALALSALAATAPAEAAEDVPTYADRSTKDVVDVDRTFAIMLNPLAIATGVYGAETLDFVARQARLAAATRRGRHLQPERYDGDRLRGRAPLLPECRVPRPSTSSRTSSHARPLTEGLVHFDLNSDAFGFGATAGWQWTWDYGFSVRLGGGGMYFIGGPSPTPNALALSGPQFVMDGSIGWAF